MHNQANEKASYVPWLRTYNEYDLGLYGSRFGILGVLKDIPFGIPRTLWKKNNNQDRCCFSSFFELQVAPNRTNTIANHDPFAQYSNTICEYIQDKGTVTKLVANRG